MTVISQHSAELKKKDSADIHGKILSKPWNFRLNHMYVLFAIIIYYFVITFSCDKVIYSLCTESP